MLEHGRISVGRLGNTSQRKRALDHDSAAPLHVTLLSPVLDETTEGMENIAEKVDAQAQRPGPEDAVVALLGEQVLGRPGHLQLDALLG